MTASLDRHQLNHLQKQARRLLDCLDAMQPILRQMHLLSSNAVSAAARAGSEGDAFRVLTQAIEALGQEIHRDLRQAQAVLSQCLAQTEPEAVDKLLRQLEDVMSALPLAVRKGDYLAICASVEAAHTQSFEDSFNAVAVMLKQRVADLRQQVERQQSLLAAIRGE
jgi:uncharacterized protein YceH (UPF0502 family)